VTQVPLETVAYRYAEPYWSDSEGNWVKSLLPFFDSVGILLPAYMYGRHLDSNPWLAGPLEEQGLLHVTEPESFIDQQMTADLCEILHGLLLAGLPDDLKISEHRYGYHELSQSRLGQQGFVSPGAPSALSPKVHSETSVRMPYKCRSRAGITDSKQPDRKPTVVEVPA
jgi:hypothetical protein